MNEKFELGRRIRSEVLGEEAVQRRLDQADAFNRDFQQLVTEYCWGAGWGRTALSRRDRSLMNLGMLSAVAPDEIRMDGGPLFRCVGLLESGRHQGLVTRECQDAFEIRPDEPE